MAEKKTNKLPDPDTHLMKKDYYNRLRAAIEKIAKQVFRKDTINIKVRNFIPHLKRTDRDLGGLSFYSKQYPSTKLNKDHALLCLISMLVQVWWDINAGTLKLTEGNEGGIDELDVFDVNLALLESIADKGMDGYRMYGKFPDFQLMTLEEVNELDEQAEKDATEELKEERAECDKIEEEQQRDAVEAAEQAKLEDEILGEHDRIDDAKQQRDTEPVETDQVSTEAADACAGDCCNCDVPECQENQVAEDDKGTSNAPAEDDGDDICDGGYIEPPAELVDLAGAEAKAALGLEDEATAMKAAIAAIEGAAEGDLLGQAIVDAADPREAQKADGEHYPDAEPLEQTAKDQMKKDATPPMPKEEADYQGAADHETGADQVDVDQDDDSDYGGDADEDDYSVN